MMFKYPVKQNFTVQNEAEISRPPTVDFGSVARGTTGTRSDDAHRRAASH